MTTEETNLPATLQEAAPPQLSLEAGQKEAAVTTAAVAPSNSVSASGSANMPPPSSIPAHHSHATHHNGTHSSQRASATPVSSSAAPSGGEHHHANGSSHRSERDPREHRDRDREREQRERRSRRTLGDYALGKTLGAGSMGKVKLAVRMGDGEKVAIKIIPRNTSVLQAQSQAKAAAAAHAQAVANGEVPPDLPTGPDGKPIIPGRIPSAELARLAAKDAAKEVRTIREGSLQLLLHHPYVCGMREMMIHTNHYYMVFEFVNGGQMLDYIISHGRLRERAARKFARQIGSALEYCHRNSIVHRDLKIENILISGSGNIKIIDFGLSNLFSPHSHLSTFCGSLYFAAPELLQAKVYTGPEVDVWSFGIVLYVLVNGKVPFDDQSMPALHAKIKRGQVEYPAWLTPECKHILSRMLNTNPAQRATLPEVLSHPWMVKGYDGAPDPHIQARQPLRPDMLDPEVIKGMTGFEFGTAEDIQTRMLEILTSDTYLNVLRAWEARNSAGVNSNSLAVSPNASSTAVGSQSYIGKDGSIIAFADSHNLNRQSTRSSMESGTTSSKVKNATKRFSGIDFYRKKIAGNGLFGGGGGNSGSGGGSGRESEDRNGSNGSGAGMNGVGGPPGGQWSGPGVKEPLDPTRGYHPLLSIYYLVSEKMERERVYGSNFFASSNVSIVGPPVPPKPSSSSSPGPLSVNTGVASPSIGGSMPTPADIPQAQDALRVPEATRVSKRGKEAIPSNKSSTGPSPVTSGVAHSHDHHKVDSSPTPIFDSRQKSQPMPNMAGPPRARAMGDEVEAALRRSGSGHANQSHAAPHHRHSVVLGAPHSATTSPPSAGGAAAALAWQQQQQQQYNYNAGVPSSARSEAHGGADVVLPPLPASAGASSSHKRSLSLNMRNQQGGSKTDPQATGTNPPGIPASASAGSAGNGSSGGIAAALPLLAKPMARLARAGGGSNAENRRSVHIMMSPRNTPAAENPLPRPTPSTEGQTSPGEAVETIDSNGAGSGFGFGNTLSRRIGSLIGRSPSTPLDSDSREKRRLARMSTGGMFGAGGAVGAGAIGPGSPGQPATSSSSAAQGSGGSGPGVNAYRRGSLHIGTALGRTDEEVPRVELNGEGEEYDHFGVGGTGGAQDMKRSGTTGGMTASASSGLAPETPAKGSVLASMGRAAGNKFLSSSASASDHNSRRPLTAGALLGSPSGRGGEANANSTAAATAGPGPEDVFGGDASDWHHQSVGDGDGDGDEPVTPSATSPSKRGGTGEGDKRFAAGELAMMSKPVVFKGLFSVSTTTTRPREQVLKDLVKVLDRIGLQFHEIAGGYRCTYMPSLDFSGAAEAGKGNIRLEQAGPAIGGGGAYQTDGLGGTSSGGTETLADLRSPGREAGGYDASSNVGDSSNADTSSARGPKRRTSRMSFASSKKDRRNTNPVDDPSAATGGVDSTSSVGASTAVHKTAGEPSTPGTPTPAGAGGLAPRSRASSITADFSTGENDSAVGAAREAALAAAANTGQVTVEPSPNASANLFNSSTIGTPSVPASPAAAQSQGSASTAIAQPVAQPAPTAPVTNSAATAAAASRLKVVFEVFVVKVPLLMYMNGIRFNRVSGNAWQYQVLAKRVLQELKL
ncbi:Serine/threonine-protein kinase [Tilletia horrida]|nr:Serine/threonine-protein kinase [Tilletia horrida]